MVGFSARGVGDRLTLAAEGPESNDDCRGLGGGNKDSEVSPSLYAAREILEGGLRDFALVKWAANFTPRDDEDEPEGGTIVGTGGCREPDSGVDDETG